MKKSDQEEQIIRSWHLNAGAWNRAIQNSEIESRVRVTDQALLNTLESLPITSALDLGCGEGWLSNHLQKKGIRTLGIDAVPELIAIAKEKGRAEFKEASYQNYSRYALREKFDVAICNFSLLGRLPVEELLGNLHNLIKTGGFLVIQTVHPESVENCTDGEGWRPGSWDGFNEQFTDPPPWYFRSIANWRSLFAKHKLKLISLLAPQHPETRQPASIIFVVRLEAHQDLA